MWDPKAIKDNLDYYLYWNLKDKGHRKPGGEAGSQEAEAKEHNNRDRRQHAAPGDAKQYLK